jgi:hypothetical protein
MQGKKNEEGFEVEWAVDQLVIRSDYTDEPDEEVKKRARAIAVSHCHAMGYRLGQKLTPALARIQRTPAPRGTSDISLPLEDNAAHLRDKAEVELYHGFDLVVAVTSEDIDPDEVFRLAERARKDLTLGRVLEYIGEFRADPERKLGPLYDILRSAEKKFGNRAAAVRTLKVSRTAWDKAARILNDESIRTARKRGKSSKPLRDITDEELDHCIKVAEGVIDAYAARQ